MSVASIRCCEGVRRKFPGCSPSPRRRICGVSYDKSADSSRCWVSPWRAPLSCHSVLPGVPSPPEMPWWRAAGQPRRLADETGWKQGGRRVWLWVLNLRETVYEILPGRGLLGAGEKLRGLGVDGALQGSDAKTCYNHLLHRCHEHGDGHARGGALPTLGQGHPPDALALRDRTRMLERSARMACDVDEGLLQADEACCTADSPILDSRNICDAIGTTSLCSSSGRRGHQLPPNKTFRRGQPQDLRQPYRERGTGPDPHERPPELPSRSA